MEQIGGEDAGQRTSLWQVIGASVIGTIMEWYDFFIFAAAAALVFPALFFPEREPLTGTLLAFGTYGLGFFARPLGGIIFGNLGDKIGRKTVLVITLLLMGIATTLIGVLPTFERLGLWAAVLLIALRILQGLGAGAEFGGAVIMAAEYSPQGKRGLYASLPCTGVAIGLLLSSGVFSLFAALPEEQFLAWGWRVPFLLSIVVVAVGLYVRLRILETPVFSEVKETNTEVGIPVLEVVRSQPRNLLVAIGARFSENGNAYIIQTFTLTYVATQLGMSDNVALRGVLIASAIGIFTIPLFGALSDRVGRRPVYMFGSAFLALFSFPFFWLLNTETSVLIWLAIVLANSVGVYSMFSPQAAYFAELFGTRVRYSGASIGYQLASVFAGGLAFPISTYLIARYDYQAIAIYMALMALITVVSVLLAPETYRGDINETGPQERELITE